MLTTATIKLLGDLGATLTWENTGSLGQIKSNEVSIFNVKANLTTSSFTLKYKLNTGTLPVPLSLNLDGTIIGKIQNWSETPPIISTYTFSVSALDTTNYIYSTEEFSVTAVATTSTVFTEPYFKPYISLEKRKEFKNFINDDKIFIPEFIYRKNDPNFGVQQEMRLTLHFGAELNNNFENYAEILEKNFAKRKIKLGSIKSAIAKENKKNIYELIYVDVIDEYAPSVLTSTATSFSFNGITYYPPSIKNMRSLLENTSTIETTDLLDPKFTKTLQPNNKILNYIPFVPLCYCIPGKSYIFLDKIKKSGFKFNMINFEIDRLLFKKSINTQDRYLLFKR